MSRRKSIKLPKLFRRRQKNYWETNTFLWCSVPRVYVFMYIFMAMTSITFFLSFFFFVCFIFGKLFFIDFSKRYRAHSLPGMVPCFSNWSFCVASLLRRSPHHYVLSSNFPYLHSLNYIISFLSLANDACRSLHFKPGHTHVHRQWLFLGFEPARRVTS